MRIKEELIAASQFNPTETSHKKTISDLCSMIEAGTISLPVYQRDLSWNLRKCIELLNYQLLGKAPVSPISMNIIQDINNCVPQVSFIDRDTIYQVERGQLSVVDGQQRLTTNFKAYTNHEDFKTIALDLVRGCFIQNIETVKGHQIPVGVLLNRDDKILSNYCSQKRTLNKFDVQSALLQIKSKVKNYYYTLNQAIDLTEEEQIEWFEVLNNAGSRVTDIQMRFAKMRVHDVDIYSDYARVYVEKIESCGYTDFFKPHTTNLTYPVAALNPAYILLTGRERKNNFAPIAPDTKQVLLSKLEPDKLKRCFELTLDALDKAIEFIGSNRMKRPDRVDFLNYLIGFFVINNNGISSDVNSAVVKWVNETDFTNKSNTDRRKLYESLINISDAKQ